MTNKEIIEALVEEVESSEKRNSQIFAEAGVHSSTYYRLKNRLKTEGEAFNITTGVDVVESLLKAAGTGMMLAVVDQD